jgi:hypothetical protein
MEKKESVKRDNSAVSKTAGLSGRAFGIIKFILGVCFLPFVYSFSVSFLNEFGIIQRQAQDYFWAGVISLLIIYLFVWEPAIIYAKSQKILEVIFSFFKPLVRVAPYLLPIYTLILFVLCGLLSVVFKSDSLIRHFIFLIGFSIALHLIFSARTIRPKQGDFLKANYIFGFSLVYIINVSLLAFCLNLFFKEFSFVNFISQSYQIAKNIFYSVFSQLFL